MIAIDAGQIERRLLPHFDRAIVKLLEFDPETRAALAALAGRVVAVEVAGVDRTIFLLPDRDGLRVRFQHEGEVHVRIRGAIAGFITLARCRMSGRPIPAGTVDIVGDLSTAQRLQAMLARVDIDWEEMLSRLVGDTAARKLGNLTRDVRRWLTASRESMAMNVSEYVRYETEVVPEREAVDEFMQDVDALRADSDRLAERVRRLRGVLAGRDTG